MQFHLPLNPVDRLNQPPAYYLTVQDGLILVSSALWTVAYVLYIRQAFRDKSYGMPLLCLYLLLQVRGMPSAKLTDGELTGVQT